MAWTAKGFDNTKTTGFDTPSLAKLRKIDSALTSDCSGYSVADVFANDKQDGRLGAAVIDELNRMTAAMANAGAHYTAKVFYNDKTYGHLGPDLCAKLTAASAYVATLRP